MQFTSTDKTIFISASQETPVLLVEMYQDSIVEYGVQFIAGKPAGLLIRSVSNSKIDSNSLADGGICIYTYKNSDCRLFMPSPNVKFAPLKMRHFTHTVDFAYMSRAIAHPKIIHELSEVSLDIYAHLWRESGANIGRKVNGRIQWEQSFLLN